MAGVDYRCDNLESTHRFPVVDGVPVLIDENSSVFTLDDFRHKRKTYFDPARKSGLLSRFGARLFSSFDITTGAKIVVLAELVRAAPPPRHVLIIGAGTESFDQLAGPDTELIVSDVSLTSVVNVVCDAHDIPFDGETFDAVIAVAVLEHVADPQRCAHEIHRVLKPRGVIFAVTPFVQQVHGGQYDFTRFTHLGHRRLFRQFEEIESGAAGGPGVALSWAIQYFFMGFATSRWTSRVLRFIARACSFWLEYFDLIFLKRPWALDGAAAVYFLGRKSDRVLPDRELIAGFRGNPYF